MTQQANTVRISVLSVAVVFLASCNDLSAPNVDVPSKSPPTSLASILPPRLLSDHLRDAAIRAPGFAGVSVDANGGIIISTTADFISNETALAVKDLFLQIGRRDLQSREVRLKRVKYDYATLDRFLAALSRRIVGAVRGVHTGGISDHNGRILIGVDQSAAAAQVRSEADKLGIPYDALLVEVSEAPQDAIGLRDTHSYMRGGLAVSRHSNPEEFCTIGFVGWLKDEFGQPDYSYRIITTASHCTTTETVVIGDVFGQPLVTRRVGVEVDEAIVYPAGNGNCTQYNLPASSCRYADVAVIRLDDSVASAAGSVAKSSSVVWPTNPPYLTPPQAYVGGGVVGGLTGEFVTKVGATTGQRVGEIVESCVYRLSGHTPNLYTLCEIDPISWTPYSP
jgi:hypothetical protein